MMKRIVAITLVVIMVAALFVGCGSSSPEGLYRVKTMNGQSLKDAMMAEMGSGATEDQLNAFLQLMGIEKLEDIITFDLQSGGKVVASMMGEKTEGTWKVDGEKITITIDGDAQEGTFKNGEITIEEDGMKMVLAK